LNRAQKHCMLTHKLTPWGDRQSRDTAFFQLQFDASNYTHASTRGNRPVIKRTRSTVCGTGQGGRPVRELPDRHQLQKRGPGEPNDEGRAGSSPGVCGVTGSRGLKVTPITQRTSPHNGGLAAGFGTVWSYRRADPPPNPKPLYAF